MKAFKIFSLAAVAFMMVACSSEDTALDNTPIAGQKVHFTATIAAPGSDALTRTTYTEITSGTDAGKIKVAWEQGDEIALIHNGKKDVVTVQTLNADGSANISGDITVGTDGEAVTIVYPAASVNAPTSGAEPVEDATYATKWNSQDGTLTYIQDNLDFCRATSTLKVSGTNATLSDNIALKSTIAIVKFSLTDGTDALDATQFIIKDGSDNVMTTVTPASATSELYVAMAPAATSNFNFEATDGTSTYTYSKASATIEKGKFYQSPMTMTNVALSIPLTLEAIEDGTIHVTFGEGLNLPNPITYAKNGVEYSGGTTNFDIEVVAGDIVSFHSTNAVLAQLVGYEYKYSKIQPTNRCYIYGNVMSLIDDQGDFAADKVIGGDLAFEGLFNQADKLENHPTKELLLPATILTINCYSMMFNKCKALTKAPKLPAAELKERCYSYMFEGCEGLTEGPIMSATTLATSCCLSMFQNCTNLVKAPVLRATTLARGCYQYMFSGCSSLNYVKCLAMDIGDANFYSLNNWLNNVSATGTLVVSSGATWAVAGTNGIPADWTVTSE